MQSIWALLLLSALFGLATGQSPATCSCMPDGGVGGTCTSGKQKCATTEKFCVSVASNNRMAYKACSTNYKNLIVTLSTGAQNHLQVTNFCCNQTDCNQYTGPLSVPSSKWKNGIQCNACQNLTNANCSTTVIECMDNEDKCFKATGTEKNGKTSFILMGCATSTIYELAAKDVLPIDSKLFELSGTPINQPTVPATTPATVPTKTTNGASQLPGKGSFTLLLSSAPALLLLLQLLS